MKVNIGGLWYDSEDIPIQIQLGDEEKEHITKMAKHAKNYISFPDTMDWEEAKRVLGIEEPADKPDPEKYGYYTSTGFDGEPSGWCLEGGEEAYNEALELWNISQS